MGGRVERITALFAGLGVDPESGVYL